ncbi:MAG: hypothetical protein K0R54_4101, partial [Clostridiaceae bacterium]|nr:hypothetical protein [Clostridiaceae bacterium]
MIKENVFNQKVYFGRIVTGESSISDIGRAEIISK